MAQTIKNLPAMQETQSLIPGWERYPGEGNGTPLQYFSLENPIGRGAWWATVHEVTELDATEQLYIYMHVCMCVGVFILNYGLLW